jgi:carboxymethylenebutenolidase
MFPDAGGLRPAMQHMADRLAALGYVVLVPDVYYRSAPWAGFDMRTAFGDEAERGRLVGLMQSVTADKAVSDARAFAEYLQARPETTGGPIGTTGYCMGGRLSLIVAGHLGETIGAAASFHGGGIASAEDPDSPHRRADSISAPIYVAGAIEDGSFDDAAKARLESALSDAGVQHTIETYPAHHGFAVPDNPTYDEAAAARHYDALAALYGRTLASA